MTKIFSAKYWMVLISACCIGSGIVFACSDGWGDEYGVSNFSPQVFVDSAYTPFFYSYQYYYQLNYDEQQHTRFTDSDVNEWSAYFNKQLNKQELEYLLLNTGFSIDSLAAYVAGKSAAPAAVRSFALLQQKNDKKVTAFINYLQLAGKCAAFSLNNIVPSWELDDKPKKVKVFDATSLNKKLLAAFSSATDPFVKERYWFQLERSYFFNGGAQQAVELFNSNEKNMPHDNMYFRTMAYAAGAYYKLKHFSNANYYYSKVFEGCTALKTVAHYSFHPQEEKDWNATLALCKDNNEKITLWQMLGIFYADEQRSIKEIYLLNPASDKLDVLLARAVNKYEQKFDRQDGNPIGQQDTVTNTTLPALITKIAAATNTGKPWIWELAAGYLQTLNKHYGEAATMFVKAEKIIPNTKAARAQLRLLKIINTVGQAKRIDSKIELQVLNDIEWLRTLQSADIPGLRYTDAFEWVKQKMAAKYQQQQDFVKAECFSSKTFFYADKKNVDNLNSFLNKPNKTPYEKLCSALCVKTVNDLAEFQSIQLAYADSITAAIAKMEQAGAGATAALAANPFNGRIQDCHDCDFIAAQKIKYSKISFLRKLKDVQANITAGEDLYNNAILLANAHYNISHFGNARLFYECKVLGDSHSDPSLIDSVFRKMVTGTAMALKYYSMALANATTDEQKAKCQYMLAKCERNQWYNETIYYKPDGAADNQAPDFKAWAGFKALLQYSNTQYYKDVIKECGYFKSYTSKQK